MKKLILIFSLLLSFNLSASNTVTIITPEWENQTNQDGSGIYFDILREVYSINGIKIKHQISSWKRAQLFVKEGRFDAMCGKYFLDNQEYITPKYPVIYETTVAVSKKKLFNHVDDSLLRAKTLIWPIGYGYNTEFEFEFEFDVHFLEVADTNIGFKNLLSERADFLIDTEIDVQNYLKNNSSLKSILAINELFEKPAYVVFSPTERGRELAEIFDNNMSILIKNGKIEEIYKKYGFEYREIKARS